MWAMTAIVFGGRVWALAAASLFVNLRRLLPITPEYAAVETVRASS
jgi:hypothetical protein